MKTDSSDKPFLGILLMLGFCVIAPTGDAIAKLLGGIVPLGMLVTVRFAVQVVLLLPIVAATGLSLRLTPRAWRLTIWRTLLHIAGISAMFLSLQFLPLADAVAIAFVMPFIMLLLGRFVLDEVVGQRRIWACLVGFIGTLLVVQPSFAAVGAPALLPLLVAVVFALFMLVTRQLAKETDPVALQCVSGIIATALLVPTLIIGSAMDYASLEVLRPAPSAIWLLLLLGALGTLAHLLMTWSLRLAPSATLAPMQYLEIPVATVVGLIMFGDFPNGLALLGIIVTMAAGLYIINRERLAQRAARQSPQTAE